MTARGTELRQVGERFLMFAVAAAALISLAWGFVQQPGSLARGRDPAQITWRSQALLSDRPDVLLEQRGPDGILSGGYRVTGPLTAGLLDRLAGVGTVRATAVMQVLLPLLASLAVAGFAYRYRRDALAFVFTLGATVPLFMTRLFVGYLDDQLALALLAVALAMLDPARDSWGPRVALGGLVFLAFLTHIPTALVFVAAVAAWGIVGLAARGFSLRRSIEALGPPLAAVATGALAGVAVWYAGPWGVSTEISDSFTVQPYPASFFRGRLIEWLHPFRQAPTFVLLAAGAAWLAWRVARRRADGHVRMTILWALPVVGAFGYVLGLRYNYYRFLNATLAPALLIGAGAWILARGFVWLGTRHRLLPVVATAGVVLVGVLVWSPYEGSIRFLDHQSEWTRARTRVSLTAVAEYAATQPDRPLVFVIRPPLLPVRGWGLANQWAHIALAGIRGDQVRRTYFVLGSIDDFLAGEPAQTGNAVLDHLSRGFLEEERAGVAKAGRPPVAFFVRAFYRGPAPPEQAAVQIVEGVSVITGGDMPEPDLAAVDRAAAAADGAEREIARGRGVFDDPGHVILVGAGLVLLLVAPGLLAARWLGLRGLPDHLAFVPGLSLAMMLTSAFVVEAAVRRPFGPIEAWLAAGLALAAGLVARFLPARRDRSPIPATDPNLVVQEEAGPPSTPADESSART